MANIMEKESYSLATAILVYFVAWMYARGILMNLGTELAGIWIIAFTLVYLAWAESAGLLHGKPRSMEAFFWDGTMFFLSILFVRHLSDELFALYAFLWHMAAICLALCQGLVLKDGKTDRCFPLYLLCGMFAIPYGNIFLRISTIIKGVVHAIKNNSGRTIIVSLVISLPVCFVAFMLLSDASAVFANIRNAAYDIVSGLYFIKEEDIFTLALSIPIGAWLYGLVEGSMRSSNLQKDVEEMLVKAENAIRLPVLATNMLVFLLSLLYAFFFLSQGYEFFAYSAATVVDAYQYANRAFWSLLEVTFLNIAVHYVTMRLSMASAIDLEKTKKQAMLLDGFNIGIWLIALLRLLAYIRYGLTARRLVALLMLLTSGCAIATTQASLQKDIDPMRITALFFFVAAIVLGFLPIL